LRDDCHRFIVGAVSGGGVRPILLAELADGFQFDLSFAELADIGAHRQSEYELRIDLGGARGRWRRSKRSKEDNRSSSCTHDGYLYRMVPLAAQAPAAHFIGEGGEAEIEPVLFGSTTGECCFTRPLTCEGEETEMDPPLFGGRTGEFCFTGPPTTVCFVGPPTEFCAEAG
jgi:hypothetical protein